jgi:hypothetical protein
MLYNTMVLAVFTALGGAGLLCPLGDAGARPVEAQQVLVSDEEGHRDREAPHLGHDLRKLPGDRADRAQATSRGTGCQGDLG